MNQPVKQIRGISLACIKKRRGMRGEETKKGRGG